MLVHRTHLLVAKVARTEACRPNLNAVHVFQKDGDTIAEASDGHRLVRVIRPTQSDADFPKQNDAPSADLGAEGLTIPAKACADALKSLPKKCRFPLMADNLRLEQGPANDVVLVATDLETTARTQARPLEGGFPNVDQILNKNTEPVLRVAVNAEYLRDMGDLFAKLHAADGNRVTGEVRMTFYDDMSAIRMEATLDGGHVVALLMPLRMTDENRLKQAA